MLSLTAAPPPPPPLLRHDATPPPRCRDALRQLGFRCHYEERYWELEPRHFSAEREEQLRALLREGELPEGVVSPRKHRRSGEGVAAGGADAEAQEQQLQEGEEAVTEFHEGSAAHVLLRRGADGYVTLEGAGLWNIRCAAADSWLATVWVGTGRAGRAFVSGACPAERSKVPGRAGAPTSRHIAPHAFPGPRRPCRPMLERILHFAEVPVSSGTAAAPGVGAPLPRWRSAWPLSGAEAEFVGAVMEHRKRSLRSPRHDEHEPIPPREGLGVQGGAGERSSSRATGGQAVAAPAAGGTHPPRCPPHCLQAWWCRRGSGRARATACRCGGPSSASRACRTTLAGRWAGPRRACDAAQATRCASCCVACCLPT